MIMAPGIAILLQFSFFKSFILSLKRDINWKYLTRYCLIPIFIKTIERSRILRVTRVKRRSRRNRLISLNPRDYIL